MYRLHLEEDPWLLHRTLRHPIFDQGGFGSRKQLQDYRVEWGSLGSDEYIRRAQLRLRSLSNPLSPMGTRLCYRRDQSQEWLGGHPVLRAVAKKGCLQERNP